MVRCKERGLLTLSRRTPDEGVRGILGRKKCLVLRAEPLTSLVVDRLGASFSSGLGRLETAPANGTFSRGSASGLRPAS